LIQECCSLLSKPNFVSILCYSVDNPLHHQKVCTTWRAESFPLINWFPLFNKIFGNKMFQTWSKLLENEGIWALYRVFPLFSSENTFFSVHKKNIEVSFQQFQRYGNFKYRQLWRLMIDKKKYFWIRRFVSLKIDAFTTGLKWKDKYTCKWTSISISDKNQKLMVIYMVNTLWYRDRN
jgi:hypothetical protein